MVLHTVWSSVRVLGLTQVGRPSLSGGGGGRQAAESVSLLVSRALDRAASTPNIWPVAFGSLSPARPFFLLQSPCTAAATEFVYCAAHTVCWLHLGTCSAVSFLQPLCKTLTPAAAAAAIFVLPLSLLTLHFASQGPSPMATTNPVSQNNILLRMQKVGIDFLSQLLPEPPTPPTSHSPSMIAKLYSVHTGIHSCWC